MTTTEKIILAVLLTIIAVCVISILEPRHELKAMLDNRSPRVTLLRVAPQAKTDRVQQSANNRVVNMQVTRGSVYLQWGLGFGDHIGEVIPRNVIIEGKF